MCHSCSFQQLINVNEQVLVKSDVLTIMDDGERRVFVFLWTEASQERIRAVKDGLQSCKNLLHCKRDELRRLWIEGVEMKTVHASLDAVEQVKDVAEQIPGLIAGRKYLTATELVISSLAILDTELSDVDALQQVSVVFSLVLFKRLTLR